MNQQDQAIVDQAISILEANLKDRPVMVSSPKIALDFLRLNLENKEYEVFAVMFLDTKNRMIEFKEMFRGTIDSAPVFVREIAKESLYLNASALIIAHNHPSGISTPSEADKAVTENIRVALELFNIRVLDHFVIGSGEYHSFAENGWL